MTQSSTGPQLHPPLQAEQRSIGIGKLFAMACGAIMSLFGLTIVAVLAFFATQPEGGVLLGNELGAHQREHLEASEVPVEDAIAYYDRSMSLDASDLVVVTPVSLIHIRDGRRNEIRWNDVVDVVHQGDDLGGDVIELETREGRFYKISVAVLNGGPVLAKQIDRLWRTEAGA